MVNIKSRDQRTIVTVLVPVAVSHTPDCTEAELLDAASKAVTTSSSLVIGPSGQRIASTCVEKLVTPVLGDVRSKLQNAENK